jgi:ElaB/YqjD/DUF883 family membrane-anchored ribosome-binding protein
MKVTDKDVSRSTIDRVSATAHQVIDDATSAATPAANWLSEQVDVVDGSRKKLVGESSRYISTNPLKAVAIAIAAGYLISRIIG